jgi:hypothetical protein
MSENKKPLVFISYTQFDDDHEGGALSRFRDALLRTLRFLAGEEVVAFERYQGIFCHQGQSCDFCTFLMQQNADTRTSEPNMCLFWALSSVLLTGCGTSRQSQGHLATKEPLNVTIWVQEFRRREIGTRGPQNGTNMLQWPV